MKVLHKQRGDDLNMEILYNQDTQNFIEAHAAALDSTIKQRKMSSVMRDRLEKSNYIFSGIKTFHELKEAFPSLIDENGNRKPFNKFLKDVQSIDETYNRNYLRTEYNFVQASGTMAAKWENYSKNAGAYYLRYRTAGDSRVRSSHKALDGITLPFDDPFWDRCMPPNGHNCRCTVVQVRKRRYEATDSAKAAQLADQTMAANNSDIFNFNPGKERKSVPDYNPYTIRQCNRCSIAKGEALLKAGSIPNYELCKACIAVRQCELKRDNTYKHGKGTVSISRLVKKEDTDYSKLVQVAESFAKDGATVQLTPKMSRPPKFNYQCVYGSLMGTKYEGKCPDFNINGKWYEHEGFTTNNPKNAFRNMLHNGLKQSDRLIIDKPNLTEAYMKRAIKQRIKEGQAITEVWLKTEKGLQLLYKKSEE